MAKPTSFYGGQAVIEGVMMKGKKYYTIATRTQEGNIKVKKKRFISSAEKIPFFKWPFIRGVVNLFETMIIGIKSLNYSANQFQGEEEKLSTLEVAGSIILAFVFAIGLFKFLPFFLTGLSTNTENKYLFAAIEGVIKITIFVIYIYLISLMKDINRVFQYHGAEHKTIHCYESGKDLTVKNAKQFSLLHPRCGTTFIIIVIFISIVLYVFIPAGWSFWAKFLGRVVLLFPIASISYEFLRFTGMHQDRPILRWISRPGMQFQRLTTREPDDSQLEVALESFKRLLHVEEGIKTN